MFSGLLIAYLTQSGFLLQRLNFAPEIIDIIISVIIYFSALALLLKSVIQFFLRDKNTSQLNTGEDPEPDKDDASPEGGDV
jgi:simple sugar transport system permease protein